MFCCSGDVPAAWDDYSVLGCPYFVPAGRINDHHHNLKHYFIHQLNASLEKPMQWCAGTLGSNAMQQSEEGDTP